MDSLQMNHERLLKELAWQYIVGAKTLTYNPWQPLATVPPRPTSRCDNDSVSSHLGLEPLCDSLPVDNVPNSAKVLSLAVLVLQVVCVLPSVDAQQWDQVASNRVLVRTGHKRQSAGVLVLGQPRPAASLDTSEGSVGLFLER